jgi:peroxiredoxin family protein
LGSKKAPDEFVKIQACKTTMAIDEIQNNLAALESLFIF